MLIAIPSKGRPQILNSSEIFKEIDNCIMFVPENEKRDYCNYQPVKVIGVPNKFSGITKTRNWILDYANGDDVVFIDDDVKFAGITLNIGYHKKTIRKNDGNFWINEFNKIFSVCYGINAKIWGLKTESSSKSNYTYFPFRTASYITASCMGILGDTGLRFDENFPVKEDYEICLRCLKEDGLILSAQYIVWENDHWYKDGGCKTYRTGQMELDCIKRLQEMYPGMVRVKQESKQEYCIKIL